MTKKESHVNHVTHFCCLVLMLIQQESVCQLQGM